MALWGGGEAQRKGRVFKKDIRHALFEAIGGNQKSCLCKGGGLLVPPGRTELPQIWGNRHSPLRELTCPCLTRKVGSGVVVLGPGISDTGNRSRVCS